MRNGVFLGLIWFVLTPSLALAQDDFSALKLKLGQMVYVTTRGSTIRGRVSELSPTALKVGTIEFHPGPDLKIERAGVPIWKGALIGAGIAAVSVQFIYPHNKDRARTTPVAGLAGALWGSWLRPRRTVIYLTAPSQVAIGFRLK